jgi:hypothetical protein
MKPTKDPNVNFINSVNRGGAGMLRLRLTAEEVKKLRAAESIGHDEAIKTLLGFLSTRRPAA